MADRKHASKHGAQNINNSISNMPGKSKIQKPDNTNEVMEEENV